MSSEELKDKRKNRLKLKNSHHSSHKFVEADGNKHHKLEPYHRTQKLNPRVIETMLEDEEF